MGNLCGCGKANVDTDGEDVPIPQQKKTVQNIAKRGGAAQRTATTTGNEGPAPKRQRKADDRQPQAMGHVTRLVNSGDRPPFGFIKPSEGGADLYFNEALLGDGKNWAGFSEIVSKHETGTAPVLYVKSEYNGRAQAKGVIALSDVQIQAADADADGEISTAEMAAFLKAHPALQEASLTKREREYRQAQERRQGRWEQEQKENEAEAKEREILFQRHDAAEDALYKKRDQENAEAARLREEGNQLWNAGEKQRSKDVQAKAQQHRERAQQYKQQAVDLDWKNNEEMFEHVQTREHRGRARDGTWIDLHGLSVDFAEHKTNEALKLAKQKRFGSLEIITGAGNHSGKGGPKVKRRIHALFGEMRLRFEEENAGSVIVHVA